MRTFIWLTFGTAITALSLAHAVDLSGDPYGLWKPLQGAVYKFHSGVVADAAAPTASDSRLTFLVDGKAAKEIFDSIGPDFPDACSGDGDRERRKKGIVCDYTAKFVTDKDGPYRCWIGLDLRTGNTVNTITC